MRVESETASLKKVIIHRPDKGIGSITPEKATEWLYEDIVFLEKMQEEHDVFTALLKWFVGEENVVDVESLLSNALHDNATRMQAIKAVCTLENTPEAHERLAAHSPDELALAFITGMDSKTGEVIFPPASNFIFCRDIAVALNDHLLVTEAAKMARARESLLTRIALRAGGLFDADKIIEISSLETVASAYQQGQNPMSIEGGDVMIFDKDHVLVGCSERTTAAAIKVLAQKLFDKGVVTSVVQVDLPKERYCMHLDTVFTIINDNDCVVYEPLLRNEKSMTVTEHRHDGKVIAHKSLKNFVHSIKPNMNFIPCGDGQTPHEEREQWTDGCNLFALKAGVAVTYERNSRTAEALKKCGYTIIDATQLMEEFQTGKRKPDQVEKTVILISSHELSRARGGTHCLTLPVWRG